MGLAGEVCLTHQGGHSPTEWHLPVLPRLGPAPDSGPTAPQGTPAGYYLLTRLHTPGPRFLSAPQAPSLAAV